MKLTTMRGQLAVTAFVVLFYATSYASAGTISQWTFETSQPATAGPFSPEVGSGSAVGSHAGASTYSSPAGNGSSHSFSSNTWAIGDYYQFSVSTTGLAGIGLSFDQTSSNTGPRDFKLQYSNDGSSYTDYGTYTVLANGGAPNSSWNATTYQSAYTFSYDLSSITALDNQANIYFRLVDTSTTSANGGTVGTSGTNRVDNVTVTAVPEPAAMVLALAGALCMGGCRRVKQ
jgi:hypothetical protein